MTSTGTDMTFTDSEMTEMSSTRTENDVWACLGVYPLDMPRTPYRASEGKRSQ